MKQVLFIDTNIYLRFYDTKNEEFKKLLKTIPELKENIFITKQVVNEVNRNKLKVFSDSFEGYLNQFKVNKILLPEHLEDENDKNILKWNKAGKKLYEKIALQQKSLKEITVNLLHDIRTDSDYISKKLSDLFQSAISYSNKQFTKANERKKLGNPPGKKEDPIGDELIWEQLLEQANEIDELWIVSTDNDYFSELNNHSFLRGFLERELKEINPNINIHCFKSLGEGLKSFNKSKRINNLPSQKELNKIIKAEKQQSLFDYMHIIERKGQYMLNQSASSFYSRHYNPTQRSLFDSFSGDGGMLFDNHSAYLPSYMPPQNATDVHCPTCKSIAQFSASKGLYCPTCDESINY